MHTHVRTHTLAHTHSTYMHTHVHTLAHTCTCMHTHVHTHLHTHTAHICIHMYTHLHTPAHACTHMYTHTCTHTQHIYAYTCTHTCTHLHMHAHTYTYTQAIQKLKIQHTVHKPICNCSLKQYTIWFHSSPGPITNCPPCCLTSPCISRPFNASHVDLKAPDIADDLTCSLPTVEHNKHSLWPSVNQVRNQSLSLTMNHNKSQ